MQAPPPATSPPDNDRDGFQEMELVGVRVEQPSNSAFALLKEARGDRWLSILIGEVEAKLIVIARQGTASLRPLTHALFRDVLDAVDVRLVSARIISLDDQVFLGDLVLSNGSTVRSRPSDGIALAIRAGAPILASDEILAEAGVAQPDDQTSPPGNEPGTETAEPDAGTERPSAASRKLFADIHDSPTAEMIELELVGVRVERPSDSPVVLLKEAHRRRYLPIWIGAAEATAIAFGQQGLVLRVPLTHDLLRDILEAVGVRLLGVRINALSAGIFYSDLVLSNGSTVSARPSDAIALAIRTGAKIEAAAEILDGVGVEVPAEGGRGGT